MKTLHTAEPSRYPAFWNEEWLKRAIDELDTRKMTPEERAYFARVISANAEAVKAEKRKLQQATDNLKTEAVAKALTLNKLTFEEIASCNSVSVDFVLQVQRSSSSS